MKDIFANKPWIIMLSVVVLMFIHLALKGGTLVYYFRGFVVAAATSAFLSKIGFTGFIDGLSASVPNFKWPEAVNALCSVYLMAPAFS